MKLTETKLKQEGKISNKIIVSSVGIYEIMWPVQKKYRFNHEKPYILHYIDQDHENKWKDSKLF